MYDYDDAVLGSVVDYINEVKDEIEAKVKDGSDIDDIRDWLYDEMFVSDSVTGNASGSFYCNSWRAEESVAHNWELLEEALEEFGYGEDFNPISKGAEWCDVTIRCYMLGQVLSDAMDEAGITEDWVEELREESEAEEEEEV